VQVMARVSKSLLPFRLLMIFFLATPAFISILGPRVTVSADSLYRRRLPQDHPPPALYRRKFLGIEKIEPNLGKMSGLPGVIANLGLMLWGQKPKPAAAVDKEFQEAGGFEEPTVYTKRAPGKSVNKDFKEAGGFAPATVYKRATGKDVNKNFKEAGGFAPATVYKRAARKDVNKDFKEAGGFALPTVYTKRTPGSSSVICVSGLSSTIRQHDLQEELSKCGRVENVSILNGGKPTVNAIVTMFGNPNITKCKVALDDSEFSNGHHIHLHQSEAGHCHDGGHADTGSSKTQRS